MRVLEFAFNSSLHMAHIANFVCALQIDPHVVDISTTERSSHSRVLSLIDYIFGVRPFKKRHYYQCTYVLMYCVCYLCCILTNIAVGRQVLVKISRAVFYENSYGGSRDFSCRQTDVLKLIVLLRKQYVNMPIYLQAIMMK